MQKQKETKENSKKEAKQTKNSLQHKEEIERVKGFLSLFSS